MDTGSGNHSDGSQKASAHRALLFSGLSSNPAPSIVSRPSSCSASRQRTRAHYSPQPLARSAWVLRLSDFLRCSPHVLQALCPTLIIVRAGLRGSSRSATFTPVKGSINRSYDAPSQRNPRDVELGSRGSDGPDGMVVHVKEATEIRFDNFVSVGAACSSDGLSI